MSNQESPKSPITSCHKVEAKIYSGDEGTSHYYCPVCNESVNFDGTNPSSPKSSDWLDEILAQIVNCYSGMGWRPEMEVDEAKAAILAHLKSEQLELLGRLEREADGFSADDGHMTTVKAVPLSAIQAEINKLERGN